MSKNTLIRNSVIGSIQFVLTAILTLVSVPVFIHKLGLELYGVFALVSVIGNLNLLTNFGLNSSLLVYVAIQGKSRESDYDIAVTQIIITSVTALFTLIFIIFRGPIVENIFSVPQKNIIQSESLLVYLAIANSLLFIGQIFTAVIDALQKIYLTNISQLIYSIIYWGGIIVVVSAGGGLAAVGISALIAATIWFTIVFSIYRNIWGKMDLKGFKSEIFRVAKKQINYGTKIYISGLVGFLFEPLSKILLANFVGINSVAFFEVGTKIKGQINGILTKAFYPIFPFIASSSNNYELKSKLFDLSKKLQLIVIPLSILLAFTLPILIKIWIGKENYELMAIFTITLTTTMLLFSLPVLPIYQYLAAKNLAAKNILIQALSVVVNILIFFAFYNIFGLYTILVANSLAFLASYILSKYYQGIYFEKIFKNGIQLQKKIIGYAISCLVGCLTIRYFVPIGLWDLIIYPTVVILSFIVYVRWMKLITYQDLEQYFGTIPLLKNKLSRLLVA